MKLHNIRSALVNFEISSNTYTYDGDNNRLTSTVWRRVGGNWTPATTAYSYDAQNRVIQTINPDGGTNVTVYNLAGQQQATIGKR